MMRASACPTQSVAGCRYGRKTGAPANCCMTVNGSWCRPTISMPKSRSDGARSTGAAMTSVTSRATAEMVATSRGRDPLPARASAIGAASCRRRGRGGPAEQPVEVHDSHDDEEWADHGPRAHVAYVGREAGVAGKDVQGHQGRHLDQLEERQAGQEAPPADGDEGRDPERHVEAHLESGEERDGALRIVERRARDEERRRAVRAR